MKDQSKILLIILTCFFSFQPLLFSQSDTEPKTLPTGWEKLSPTQVMDAVDNLLNSKSIINESHLEKAATHLLGVISETEFQNSSDSKVLVRVAAQLSGPLGSKLSSTQKESIKSILQSKVSNDTQALKGSSFKDSRDNLWLPAITSGVARKNVADAAKDWFENNSWNALSPKEMADLANLLEDDKVDANDYSVRFTGNLTPTQSGTINFIPQARMVHAKLFIGGTLVLDTKDTLDKDDENDTDISKVSSPVTLTSGNAVSFQLDLTCVYDSKNDPAPVELRDLYQGWSNFILYWKGATGNQSLVPSSVFTPPQDSPEGSSGLRREIHRGSKLNDLVGTEYSPDPCWLLQGRGALSSNRNQQSQLVTELINKTQMLSTLNADDQESVFWGVKNISQHATLAQQTSLLNSLTQNPTCFQNIPASEMYHLQRSYKHLPGDPAVDAIIAWAKLSPTVDVKFGTYPSWDLRLDTFNHSNLGGYWHIGRQTQERESITKLTAALEEADGSCNQRIARILTFAHMSANSLTDWTELLDKKLKNPSLTGDKRVDWLIERSIAEGCTKAEPPPLLIGRNFLEEALGAAESESVKLRVVKELVARLAAENFTPQALSFIDSVQNQFEDTESQDMLTSFKASAEDVADLSELMKKEAKRKSFERYIASLKKRLEKALAENDSERVNRYTQLLNNVNES